MVLYERLKPHWSLTFTPTAAVLAAVPPPKLIIVFPVAKELPPTSFKVSARLYGDAAAKPWNTMPALQFCMVFE